MNTQIQTPAEAVFSCSEASILDPLSKIQMRISMEGKLLGTEDNASTKNDTNGCM